MTEKSAEPERTEPSPEKLLVDNPLDFQFHAAYLAYSDAFDKTIDVENRKKLNQNISALQQNQLDYSTFYMNISQYRTIDRGPHRFGRSPMRTQRKGEWRREMQRRERNKRHRK